MLILAVYGFFQGVMGAKYGISTTVLARQAFGRYGSSLFGIVLALTLGIGWFGWQVAFFGTTISEMFPGVWLAKPEVAIVWGGILMILTAFIGYRGLAA
ncbi:cytosine permease, partial [Bacillus haynesii]